MCTLNKILKVTRVFFLPLSNTTIVLILILGPNPRTPNPRVLQESWNEILGILCRVSLLVASAI